MTANDNSKASTLESYILQQVADCDEKAAKIDRDMAAAVSQPPGKRRDEDVAFLDAIRSSNDLKKRKLSAGHNEIAASFGDCHCSFCDFGAHQKQNWGNASGQNGEDGSSKP